MPRPRFDNLPEDKQERILEAAAREFSAHGFDGASLNQILEQAQISKGAAYYYFDDKADLYMTAVQRYSRDLLEEAGLAVEQLTAESYWPTIAGLYRQQFRDVAEKPWLLGVLKSGRALSEEARTHERLAQLFRQTQQVLAGLIDQGQALGVVRTDLPADLLLALIMALDDAHDQWLLRHWPNERPDIELIVQQLVNTWRRLLEP